MALKEFQDLWLNNIAVIATDNTMVVACNKEEGRDEVGPSLCPTMENPDLVFQETCDSFQLNTFQAAECPNQLSQPFNQTPHGNLSKLDLRAWLLEPQLSRSRVSEAVAAGIEAPQEDQPASNVINKRSDIVI